MFTHKPVAAALALAALLLTSAAHAKGPTSQATLTIDGKTYTLPHARAWTWGDFNGIPSIQKVVFAEKPLDGVDYWNSGNAFDDGEYGVVLSFRPSIPFRADPANFQFDLPDSLELYGIGFKTGNSSIIDAEGATATNYTFKKGVLTGKLAWKGEITGGYYNDDEGEWKEPVLSAWTLEFSLKPEPAGEQP